MPFVTNYVPLVEYEKNYFAVAAGSLTLSTFFKKLIKNLLAPQKSKKLFRGQNFLMDLQSAYIKYLKRIWHKFKQYFNNTNCLVSGQDKMNKILNLIKSE